MAMRASLIIFVILAVSGGCSSARNYNALKALGNELIELLKQFYARHGEYPEDLNSLKEVNHDFKAGPMGYVWKESAYFSDKKTYEMFMYPSKWSRTTLIYKCDPNYHGDTGWFTDDESGTGPVKLK
jgi:hypothetical protein